MLGLLECSAWLNLCACWFSEGVQQHLSSSTVVQDAKVRAWSCTSALPNPMGAARAAGAQQQLTTAQSVTSEAESHCSAVHTLEASRDFIFSAGGDAMIKVWQAGTLQLVRWAATRCDSGVVHVRLCSAASVALSAAHPHSCAACHSCVSSIIMGGMSCIAF